MAFLSACGNVPQAPAAAEDSLEVQAQTLDVWVSERVDRASPRPLDAAEVSGKIYAFVNPEGLDAVSFYLNDVERAGAPYRQEYHAPFDLGSTVNGQAESFDTQQLKDGVNTLTAVLRSSSGETRVSTATFVVANAPEHMGGTLLLSPNGDRRKAEPLDGQAVSGPLHVFLVPNGTVQQVEFFLDEKPVRVERHPFYDFGSTDADGSARPIDSSSLSGGEHTIRAVVTRPGARDEVTARFKVAEAAEPEPNPEPNPEPEPEPSGMERLKVSSNGHYLQTASGAPMFMLADTMWGLATLSEAEADLYFKTRKEQGFNTILGPVAWGSKFRTPAGDNLDSPKRADDPYYRHLDMLVAKAKKYGLYLGFVVQWGEADRMRIFKNPQEAYDYGRFIGDRYKDEPHLFWIGAGEYTLSEKHYAYHEAVSRGVKDAVGSRQLVTIHPAGGKGYNKQSSSDRFHKAKWLDFNSVQTWTHDASSFRKISDDWNLSPTKPVFMSETKYEGEGSDAFRVRRLAYWSTFSGSLGFGYGHGDIWAGKRDGKNWRGALQAPGAKDMRYLAALVASRSKTPAGETVYFERRPDDGVVTRVDGRADPKGAGKRGHVAALRDADGKYLMAYVPTNGPSRSLTVDMGKLSGSKAKAWWYDPSSGDAKEIGVYNASGSQTFTTPRGADDWVLVVDDASYGWGAPGR